MTHDPLPPRERFTSYYAAPRAPWDIGRPQRAFVEAGDQIRGRVIDIGCGTGVVGLGAAALGAAEVSLTDLPHLQQLAERNIQASSVTSVPHF